MELQNVIVVPKQTEQHTCKHLHVHVLVCCSLRQKCRKFMQLSIQKLTGIDNLGEELTLNFLVQCNALYPGL